MRSFKEKSFSERLDMATKAKMAALKKFSDRPAADDPAELERKAAKKAIVEAREARAAEREKLKIAEKERLAQEEAKRLEAKKVEEARLTEQALEVEKQQKAIRDARYAARKARK